MQGITKFWNMALKIGDYITMEITKVYHDMMKNFFFQAASTNTTCELKTNDTLCMHSIQWKNKQVAREATVFATLCTAVINCIRILEAPSKQIDIILATKFSR